MFAKESVKMCVWFTTGSRDNSSKSLQYVSEQQDLPSNRCLLSLYYSTISVSDQFNTCCSFIFGREPGCAQIYTYSTIVVLIMASTSSLCCAHRAVAGLSTCAGLGRDHQWYLPAATAGHQPPPAGLVRTGSGPGRLDSHPEETRRVGQLLQELGAV